MIYVMNSAVMPAGCYGRYYYTFSEVQILKEILEGKYGEYKSTIGYPQNIELIRKWTGYEIPLSRETITLRHEDKMFVMRLKSRIDIPASRGQLVTENPNDWEFGLILYLELGKASRFDVEYLDTGKLSV